MEKSSGLIIIWNKKVLLVHPTKSAWTKTYSIPKGGIEEGEKSIEAAIRETREETGVKIKLSQIQKEGPTINYRKGKGSIYKKVYTFIVLINSLDEIGLKEEIISKDVLPIKEVDWAGFVHVDELKEKLFPRFIEINEIVKNI